LRYVIGQEKNSKSGLNPLRRIWCLLHGFSSSKYILYNLKENNHKLYLSDFKRRKTVKINGPYSLLINDKELFTKIFSPNNLTAKIYGRIKEGEFYLENTKCSFSEVVNLIKTKRELIVKKVSGGGGKGVYKVTYNNDSMYLDDSFISEQQLREVFDNLANHLITEHLTQADYS